MREPNRLEVLRLAADAGTDPRSAQKALKGQPVKGLAGARLARELAKRANEQSQPQERKA